jgi:flagellar motor switch/type III secretory pathway protein FliN
VISASVNQEAKAWLPGGALKDGRLGLALEAIITAWATKWFVAQNRSFVLIYHGNSINTYDHGLGVGWSCGVASLCLTLSNSGRRQIVGRMLGSDISQLRLTTPDSHVVGKLTIPAIEDLIGGIAEYLEISADIERMSAVAFAAQVSQPYEHYSIGLDVPGSSIDFYVRSEVAISARRTLTKPLKQKPELISRKFAVRDQSVDIGARVGGTQLGYAELYGLGVGDIIILDKSLIDSLEVTIDGQVDGNVNCVIEDENGKTNLRLVTI